MTIWTFQYVWMVLSTTSGSFVFLVDYYIFCLGSGSENGKKVPEFYEKNLWIKFFFQTEETKLLVTHGICQVITTKDYSECARLNWLEA